MMRVGFLLTARLKSARLPRKILLELAGRPAIAHLLDRVKRARRIGTIVVCTSTNAQDDPLEALAAQEGVQCYRGSEGDVLLRLCEAAAAYGLDYAANITADCPLVDPTHIDWIVEGGEATGADLITASQLPTGQGPNGIKVTALARLCEVKAETETEVWGEYFTRSGLFHTVDLEVPPAWRHQTLKTSLDYPEDYEFLQAVFRELYVPGEVFSLQDVLALVARRPELVAINAHCKALGRQHIAKTATPMKLKRGAPA